MGQYTTLEILNSQLNNVVRKNGSGTITQKLFSALLWRKKPDHYFDLVGIPDDHFGLVRFSLRELQIATDNFNNKNIVRLCGIGEVYKGRLQDCSLVAVKRYTKQVPVSIREELEISSIVEHRNVICLLGFCITKTERLLVYPYMANLASCLRDRSLSQPPLVWEIRLGIALGVARGLDHLHHGCIRGIIHGEVKAANILLDDDFEAVISDFTFAKFMVRGTIGYITGKSSTLEIDVFGYGVFLLELVTAQYASALARLANKDDATLRDWVTNILEEKKFETIVDQDLEGNFVEEEVEKLLQIARICIQSDPERRPLMSEIVRMLEDGDGDGLAEAWKEFCHNGEWTDDSSQNSDQLSGPT